MPVQAAIVSLLLAAGCGSASTDAAVENEPSIQAPDAACEDQLVGLVDELKGDLADDYQPSASPSELANDHADYVVRAGSVTDIAVDDGRVSMTLADLEVLPVHETDLTEPLTIEWWITTTDAVAPDRSAYDRVAVVAFIEQLDDGYQPLVEGLYVGCGDDGRAVGLIADPIEPGWPAGPDFTLATLVTSVVDPAALDPSPRGRQDDGTFALGPLRCDDDLFEDSIGDFDDGAIGAETPEDAVDRWWTEGDGRFRDDRDRLTESIDGDQALYADERGNTQLALGLLELPAGGWAVETMMACADL